VNVYSSYSILPIKYHINFTLVILFTISPTRIPKFRLSMLIFPRTLLAFKFFMSTFKNFSWALFEFLHEHFPAHRARLTCNCVSFATSQSGAVSVLSAIFWRLEQYCANSGFLGIFWRQTRTCGHKMIADSYSCLYGPFWATMWPFCSWCADT
jgi:hypothetical protein